MVTHTFSSTEGSVCVYGWMVWCVGGWVADWIPTGFAMSQPVYLIYILIVRLLFAPKDGCVIALICTVPRPALSANSV